MTEPLGDQAHVLAAREAAVLTRLDPASLYAARATEDGTWLAVPWHDAPSLGALWRDARRDDTPAARWRALAGSAAAATAIAEMHERGWRHADLQADHILIGALDVRLIDVALAQGPEPVAPEVTYRGALAHLTTPEIAAEILATPPMHSVALADAAEVYTFGALIYAAWTGTWPHDYRTDDPRMLTVSQIHARITQPDTLRPMPATWPALSRVLSSTLDPEAAGRPTMADVAEALHGVGVGRQ